MASNYKLTYFGPYGRAEVVRLIFAKAGVAFEDAYPAEGTFPTLKPTLPFGQLPILEVDGHVIAQSKAIARFLARRFDLYGKNEFETVRVDELLEGFNDFETALFQHLFNIPEEKKAEHLVKAREVAHKWFEIFERFIAGKPFAAGEHLTIADLFFVNLTLRLSRFELSDTLAGFPAINALIAKIAQRPNIAAYQAKAAAAAAAAAKK